MSAQSTMEETMETSRRDVLKLGAGVAATGLTAAAMLDEAKAQTATAQAAPMPAGQVPADSRLRLVSYASAGNDGPKLGVVRADGRLVDLAKAAQSAGLKLSYDATSMISLMEAGP